MKHSDLLTETGSFLDVGGEQVYCLRHAATHPKGVVLLAGPFAPERPFVYVPWVRWARHLAGHGYDAVRFDYRGVGESTGDFQKMSFDTWVEDIRAVAERIRAEAPLVPLILHGLGLGALLAASLFEKGLGDALLLWSAPKSGIDVLREGLARRLSINYLLQPQGPRKTYEDYVAELKSGAIIQVEGYKWSRNLWESAAGFQLPQAFAAAEEGVAGTGRPWRHIKLDRTHTPLVSGLGQWRALNPRAEVQPFPLNPDFTNFYAKNTQWISQALNQPLPAPSR